jgi:hypothetical protein
MVGEAAAVLQYGALGLLAIVLVGIMWYVKSVEARQVARDQYEREERGRYLDTLMGLIKTLSVMSERIEGHEMRAQERQSQLMEKFEILCESVDLLTRGSHEDGKAQRG